MTAKELRLSRYYVVAEIRRLHSALLGRLQLGSLCKLMSNDVDGRYVMVTLGGVGAEGSIEVLVHVDDLQGVVFSEFRSSHHGIY